MIYCPLPSKKKVCSNSSSGDFSGGPVAKIPCSQSWGPGFDLWSGN